MVEKGICGRCGERFERSRSGGPKPTRSFCSEACRVALVRAENIEAYRERNRLAEAARYERIKQKRGAPNV